MHNFRFPKHAVTIAVAGKYTELKDAYKSIWEALNTAGSLTKLPLKCVILMSKTTGIEDELAAVDGIFVPGGFGDRGIEGKINAVKFARENKVPFFGICLGMQCSVIEYARNVCGWKDANSTEFNPKTKHPVIAMMSGPAKRKKKRRDDAPWFVRLQTQRIFKSP